ncbi:MAG: hypothetical protein WCE45_08670 [Sedimentisphaerales bacterium]
MARIALLAGLLISCGAMAQQPEGAFYKELNLIGGYSDNKGLVGKDNHMLKNSVGFEYFRKFSNKYGDYLTLDLQMRLDLSFVDGKCPIVNHSKNKFLWTLIQSKL